MSPESSIDIIKNVFESLTFPVQIKSVTQNDDGTQTLNACDIYFAQPLFSITVNEGTFEIISIGDKTITVKNSPVIAPQTFNLYARYFFHGVPRETNIELQQIRDAGEKTPMLWMLETFTDHFFWDAQDARDRDIECRLFFLTQANYEKWMVDDSYTYAIKPMRALCEAFLTKLQSIPGRFSMVDVEFDIINYAKFGVYIANQGMEKSMFSDKLAGVELRFNKGLIVLKDGVCVDC